MKDIFGTICLVGAIQALFLSIVLLIRNNNKKANRYLVLVLVFGALDLFELYLASRGIVFKIRHYQISIIPYSLIFGPSIFLYSAVMSGNLKNFSLRAAALYIPFFFALLLNVLFNLIFQNNQSVVLKYVDFLVNGGGLIFEGALYLWAFLMLKSFVKRAEDYFSSIDSLRMKLLRLFLLLLIITVILIFISYVMGGLIRSDYEILDVIAVTWGLVFVFTVSFGAVMQPDIFNRVQLLSENIEVLNEAGPMYEKFRLNPSEEKMLVRELVTYMEREKPFLEENFTLKDLAECLSISPQRLSMLLNIHLQENFYNFINRYRVNEVMEKLGDESYNNHTILTLAFEAGFNSKSSFNSMFKKISGKTPSQFRKDEQFQ